VNVPSSIPQRVRLLSLAVALLCAGCASHQHSVGLGATGANEQVARQYYFLFGFFQVNEVDAQRMAGDLTSYSIETRYGFFDMVLAPFLLPLTATSRTVIVRT
jgi:hypothetical protein